MSLLVDDWQYPVVEGDLDPNDPLVNTATEYMYQMATISYHVLHGTQTVVLDEDVTAESGEVFPAGEYEFDVDGRYWTDSTGRTRSRRRLASRRGPGQRTGWSPSSVSAPSPTAHCSWVWGSPHCSPASA